jgi:Protein of unknown function (DUF1559)
VLVVLVIFGVAILLPCAQPEIRDGSRVQAVSNLKIIGFAIHDYCGANHSLPPAVIRDNHGRPLYSWRVAILPFMEQGDLYNSLKLDEPWDSHTIGRFYKRCLSATSILLPTTRRE